MKVLGISFGRKLMNCDVLVKAALLECKAAGHEIDFIRADDLDIKNCTGCTGCVVGMVTGSGRGECHLKDDLRVIDEAIMECDALIFACPAYETMPTGRFKTICDRFGPSHDVTFRKTAYEAGIEAGKPESKLPDKRSMKPRVCGFIAVGGAMTENWLAFMLPTMYMLPMTLGMDVIDNFKYFGAMACNNVVGKDDVMDRARKMGQNITHALASEGEERTAWHGDSEGICPVCHCDLLSVSPNRDFIECPVCGIKGSFSIEDGKLSAHFSDAEKARSRLTYAGKLEHSTEIKTKAAPPGQFPNLREMLEPYKW